MAFWSKVKAAVSRILPRKRAPEVAPPPAAPPAPPAPPTVAPLEPTHPHREPERTPRTVDGLIDELYAIGVAAAGSHSVTNLHEHEEAFGKPVTRALLRNQLQATRAWLRGNPGIGNARWEARAQYMADHLREGKSLPSDPDVFFYYHGNKSHKF